MSASNWGGSAAGGGLDFQAATSALCMVHMACGTPLGWSASESDIPLSVSAETGGAGDDIALTLANGDVVEIQAKRRLRDAPELWNSLIALCQCTFDNASFYGILAVGPTSSVAIRDLLARDIIRIGLGRTDDLSPIAVKLVEKLSAASIPLSVCSHVRIKTVHVLEQDDASVRSAVAHLAHITSQPDMAWERLKNEGRRLIELRGRRDAVSIAEVIPGLRAATSSGIGPAVVAAQLLDWTLRTTEAFTIPAVESAFSLDDDWIELKAQGRERSEGNLDSLEKALTHYHEGSSDRRARRDRDSFDAESLGYFIRQCVVVAGPGMGKSQLLRRIARLLARKKESSLIVRLRPLAERMRTGETFLEAALNIGLDGSPLKPRDIQILGLENFTLLLDGLDESGTEQEEIAKAVTALATSYPRCRIVFTTRPIGYETSLLNTWRHYELLSIESSDAKWGIKRLVHAAKGETSAKIIEAMTAATAHLDYNRGHSFSAKSPLLIALLASLALNEVVAAATREGLYGQIFKLIERMTAARRDATRTTPAVLNEFLQQLGWELTAKPYADTDSILAACAVRVGFELGERPLKARSICEDALIFWEKAGIVERVRFKLNETLTFVHKTFGEYAAAKYVFSRNDEERGRILSAIEPAQQWNEIVVFLSAMGLGSELVQLALIRARRESSVAQRLLRWTRHSKDQLEPDLAGMVLQQAWSAIKTPHSGQALSIGVDLVGALEKLPGAKIPSQIYLEQPQWWTALVGWVCFVRFTPELLDVSGLLEFMDCYRQNADTRTLSRGFELYRPADRLWEELLLSAAREIVRRRLGIEENKFIDRLIESVDDYSRSFFYELKSILREVGVDLKSRWEKDFISEYLNSDFFEQDRRDKLFLLGAIAQDAPELSEPVDAPLLHLSAFCYGSNLMAMGISAGTLGKDEAKQVIRLAACLGSFDYGQLISEAQTQMVALEEGGVFFDGILAVDAPIELSGNTDSNARYLVTKALLHPSEWIVLLTANLAEELLTTDDITELVPRVLAESKGLGMAAAAHLAVHFLGKERARELIVARLKQPLNIACQHLFGYLAEMWVPSLEDQADEILTPALSFNPRTATAALGLVRACSEPYRKAIAPVLKEAYDYWRKNEGPYPTGSGVIPESPRADILMLLIEEAEIGHDDLFAAAKDRRTEVSEKSIDALLTVMLTSQTARKELVRRLQAGERLDSLLTACLRAHIPFSEQEAKLIAGLLESECPQTRYAATGILEPQYMPPSEISKWADKLRNDPYQRLRDRGIERLTSQKGASSGDA